jgi:hypothetical protein
MNAALRGFVRERAGRRCEYCRMHEDGADFLSFHLEHVVAKQHGGTDDPDILFFACAECNWAKGPNLAGLLNCKLYPLFNPRKQSWKPMPSRSDIPVRQSDSPTVAQKAATAKDQFDAQS